MCGSDGESCWVGLPIRAKYPKVEGKARHGHDQRCRREPGPDVELGPCWWPLVRRLFTRVGPLPVIPESPAVRHLSVTECQRSRGDNDRVVRSPPHYNSRDKPCAVAGRAEAATESSPRHTPLQPASKRLPPPD